MGNTNCIADGGCPQRADIVIVNNTKYELDLDINESCGRECEHKGWQVLDGKIVDEHIPPDKILPYSTGKFSVSGRDSTAVAPKGKVFYHNQEKNLKVIFEWNASGWTSYVTSSANVVITGIPESKGLLSGTPKPWNQTLIGEFNAENWTYEIRPNEGTIGEAQRTAKLLTKPKLQI